MIIYENEKSSPNLFKPIIEKENITNKTEKSIYEAEVEYIDSIKDIMTEYDITLEEALKEDAVQETIDYNIEVSEFKNLDNNIRKSVNNMVNMNIYNNPLNIQKDVYAYENPFKNLLKILGFKK